MPLVTKITSSPRDAAPAMSVRMPSPIARTREASGLLAEVFLRSSLKPDEAFLNLLDQSAARFRSDAALHDAVALLHAKVSARAQNPG